MKKNFLIAGVIIVGISVGCNNSGNSGSSSDTSSVKTDSSSTRSDTGASTKIEKNLSPLSKADSEFMLAAANAGMTEVILGNVAVKNAANEKIKSFGEMMIKDHSAAGDQLKKIAIARNITLPDSVSPDSKKHIAEMEKKKGKDFDKAYIKMMVEGHEKVLKEFEDIQSKGSDPELKSFVTQTIPVIKGHLDSAKSIKESIK